MTNILLVTDLEREVVTLKPIFEQRDFTNTPQKLAYVAEHIRKLPHISSVEVGHKGLPEPVGAAPAGSSGYYVAINDADLADLIALNDSRAAAAAVRAAEPESPAIALSERLTALMDDPDSDL